MKALIVGSDGQDGKLLNQYLIEKKYEILGLTEESSLDLSDSDSVFTFLENQGPSLKQIYFLAAYHTSSEQETADSPNDLMKSVNTHCYFLHQFLYAIRMLKLDIHLFYAASSLLFQPKNQSDKENDKENFKENFKENPISLQPLNNFFDETMLFNPTCFYGMTKAMGVSLCRLYREKYQVLASTGILFNHESQYRKSHFLTKKIVETAVKIKKGQKQKLAIGSLDAKVDWSHAEDFVEAFYLITTQNRADDYIVSSGEAHSVKEFVETTFTYLGLDWTEHVELNSSALKRPQSFRIGDSSKLRKNLGWKPKYSFEKMIINLIEKELERTSYGPVSE